MRIVYEYELATTSITIIAIMGVIILLQLIRIAMITCYTIIPVNYCSVDDTRTLDGILSHQTVRVIPLILTHIHYTHTYLTHIHTHTRNTYACVQLTSMLTHTDNPYTYTYLLINA